MTSQFNTHPLLRPLNKALVELPSPRNLGYLWNFGSLLGFCLILQIVRGILLSAHYCRGITLALERVRHISRDVDYGWLIRGLHANGARAFFICIYLHISRGLYYGSYRLTAPWLVGSTIFLSAIATAFLGYVLPWGQMSFWGATVITSLFSAIPFLGERVVTWLWGGFAVDGATLSRFYSFHFILPFLLRALAGMHLVVLHRSGSRNPLGVVSNYDKILFRPYFLYKDLVGGLLFLLGLVAVVLYIPYYARDPENFIPANPLVTPVHIQPEWYFLFAYAVLRAIPNKLGGVVALVFSVAIIFFLPFIKPFNFIGRKFFILLKATLWVLFTVVLLLTWIGARPVEAPFITTGQVLTAIYFSCIFWLGPWLEFNFKPRGCSVAAEQLHRKAGLRKKKRGGAYVGLRVLR